MNINEKNIENQLKSMKIIENSMKSLKFEGNH